MIRFPAILQVLIFLAGWNFKGFSSIQDVLVQFLLKQVRNCKLSCNMCSLHTLLLLTVLLFSPPSPSVNFVLWLSSGFIRLSVDLGVYRVAITFLSTMKKKAAKVTGTKDNLCIAFYSSV